MKAGDVVWEVERDESGGFSVRRLVVDEVVGQALSFRRPGMWFCRDAQHVHASEHAAWCEVVAELESDLEHYRQRRDAVKPEGASDAA